MMLVRMSGSMCTIILSMALSTACLISVMQGSNTCQTAPMRTVGGNVSSLRAMPAPKAVAGAGVPGEAGVPQQALAGPGLAVETVLGDGKLLHLVQHPLPPMSDGRLFQQQIT